MGGVHVLIFGGCSVDAEEDVVARLDGDGAVGGGGGLALAHGLLSDV
jgi:hypothetical protein